MTAPAASARVILAEIRDELRQIRLLAQANAPAETLDVAGAAALLHTTVRGIYQRRHAGQMPTPLSRRPLVWRKADLLALRP